MTPREYTDAARFPLTTRVWLGARQQVAWDARNLDELLAYRDEWNQLTRTQRALLVELEEKVGHGAGVLAQLSGVKREPRPARLCEAAGGHAQGWVPPPTLARPEGRA